MNRKMFRDDQWERIEHLLPGKASDPGCTARDNRVFVEAVLWILRTGSPWRDLPHEFGNWHSTTFALPVGATAASGSVWLTCWVAMPTWNNCSSTPPSFVPTNILLAPKKSGQSRHRPFARRTDNQAACGRRCAGQSVAGDPLGRADRRYRLRYGTDQTSAESGCGGRQGLRRRPFCGHHRGCGCRSCYSTPIQSPRTARVRPASLSRSQSGRAFLCTSQALQTHCHALRQTRQVLPVVHSSRVHFRLASLIVNSP